MRKTTLLAGIAVLLAIAATVFAADTNVVVDRVKSVRTGQTSPRAARLVVLIVDDVGRLYPGVTVEVLDGRGRTIQRATTNSDGALLFELRADGRVRVRASAVGAVATEARGVSVSPGHVSAVAIPMEKAR
jgi:hypothetical protein